MLSFEMIEYRLKYLKAYYVFYQFFYKSAVGDSQWKECVDKKEGRIGNPNTEAFALLLLANNYKAWLYEEKEKHEGRLMTEYDTTPSAENLSVMDVLLVNTEFGDYVTDGLSMIRDPTKKRFKDEAKKRKAWQTNFRDKNPVCAEMTSAWNPPEAGENENKPNGETSKKERLKKRRKLMKGLKKWTGKADEGERRFKGWSDSGHKVYEDWIKSIKEDETEGLYGKWEQTFRKLHAEHQMNKAAEEGVVEKYTVDRSVVWEL
jgi:hypothetical protein